MYWLKLWVIIPTYNEKENIGELLVRLTSVLEKLGISYEILVVDDNSPDGTADIVRKHRLYNEKVKLIVREGKKGLGSAILDGIRYVFKKDPEATHIVTMDADLSHRPEDLVALIKYADKADVVQGSRYVEGGKTIGWGIHRHLISKTANFLIKTLYGTSIHDNTSNYRIYNRKAAELLLRYANGKSYEWAIESLLIPVAAKLKIVEAPITFINRSKGKSKLGVKDIVKWWIYILTFRKKFKTIAVEEGKKQSS
ncbi:polyprenol monophosphomannose synthase [Staphylothermus hellenicus]|uniref:polyprenol monophosphomannose synthase n=1 Tax=Staphylothermus hellenicus TaxID=84599 RepID=UPI003CCAEEB2